MSRFAGKQTKKIELGEGEWIEILTSLPFEKIEPIMVAVDDKNPSANLKLSLPIVQAGIVNWNLKDENGELVPFESSKVAELDFSTISLVAKECFSIYFLGFTNAIASAE